MLTTLRPPCRAAAAHDAGGEVRTRVVAIDGDRLARYAHVCGFRRDRLPATFPHLLAHPLQLELLAASPFSAVGVVHIANRIVQHRPLSRDGEQLELRVSGGPVAAPPPRAHVRLRRPGVRGRRARVGGLQHDAQAGSR